MSYSHGMGPEMLADICCDDNECYRRFKLYHQPGICTGRHLVRIPVSSQRSTGRIPDPSYILQRFYEAGTVVR
jgi:hypothetical protein